MMRHRLLDRLRAHAAVPAAPPAPIGMWCEFPLCDEPATQIAWTSNPGQRPLHFALCPLHLDLDTFTTGGQR